MNWYNCAFNTRLSSDQLKSLFKCYCSIMTKLVESQHFSFVVHKYCVISQLTISQKRNNFFFSQSNASWMNIKINELMMFLLDAIDVLAGAGSSCWYHLCIVPIALDKCHEWIRLGNSAGFDLMVRMLSKFVPYGCSLGVQPHTMVTISRSHWMHQNWHGSKSHCMSRCHPNM